MSDDGSKARDRVWAIVKEFNEACVRGDGFERLASAVAEDIVFIPPGFAGRIQGRERLLGLFTETCSGVKIHEMKESAEQIDVFGDTAVVSYRYDTVWETRGRRNTQEGREILVFCRSDGAWRMCWRAIQPLGRETQPSAEQSGNHQEAPSSGGLEDECLALMAKSRACYLTTIDAQGFPETTGMDNLRDAGIFPSLKPLFAEHQLDFVAYLSTCMFSQKVGRIRENGNSSLYFCDPDAVVGLTLIGRTEVVEDRHLKNRIWQEGWTIYYPGGPEGREYGILCFRPHLARGWGKSGPFEFALPISRKEGI